jgi:hypothetical protein
MHRLGRSKVHGPIEVYGLVEKRKGNKDIDIDDGDGRLALCSLSICCVSTRVSTHDRDLSSLFTFNGSLFLTNSKLFKSFPWLVDVDVASQSSVLLLQYK